VEGSVIVEKSVLLSHVNLLLDVHTTGVTSVVSQRRYLTPVERLKPGGRTLSSFLEAKVHYYVWYLTTLKAEDQVFASSKSVTLDVLAVHEGGDIKTPGILSDRRFVTPITRKVEARLTSTKEILTKMSSYECGIRATTLTISSSCPISIGHLVTRSHGTMSLYMVRLGCHDKVDPTQPCGLPVLVRVGYVFLGVQEGEDPGLLRDYKVGRLYHIGEFAVVGGKYLEDVLARIPRFTEFGQIKGMIYLVLTFSMLPNFDCGGTHTIRSIIERTTYIYSK
jgi:hypothetical protein